MKKIDINIVIMFVVGILIGFCVSYCTISFVDSYRNLSSRNEKENSQDGYVISFDDDNKIDSTNNNQEIIDSSHENLENNMDTTNNNNNNIVVDDNDFNTNYADPVSFFEKVTNSNDENILKSGFISIVDFIFYDKEIAGYTFKGLTNEAKLTVMKYALIIDQKIDSFFPGYKESISNGVKNIYSNVKGFVVELYLDTVSVICENNESICENAKNDFQFMKKSFGLTWDFIKSLAEAGTDKLKRWYEVFRA